MKKLYLFLLFIFMTSMPLLADTQKSHAVSASDWQPGRIIDDFVFQNKSSMTVSQIQQFLDSKVPACDRWGTQPMWSGGPTRAQWSADNGKDLAPYTCLKEYVENPTTKANNGADPTITVPGGLSAAQLIYSAAQAQNINPQVFLVLLQKEQSLVTDDWPYAKQFERATGNNCPDTAPCDPAYAWLWTQVNNAGAQFNYYVNNFDEYNYAPGWNNILYNPNAACGRQSVYIENRFTAALYIYTPYVPNQAALNNMYGTGDSCSAYGNRNFWRLFNDWFGRSIGTPIVRTPSSPTYYLLTKDKKLAIPNGDILYAYGLERTPLTIVSDEYLNSVPDGGVLSTLFTIEGDPTTYLADGGRRYGIASGSYCVAWGLPCGTSGQKEIGQEIYYRMSDGGVLQYIMRNANMYYLMENGKKRPFLSAKAVVDHGYSTTGSSDMINWTNIIRESGFSLPEEGSFVKFSGSSAIYAYAQFNFYAIPDFEIFSNWYSPQSPIHQDSTSAFNNQPPATVATLSNIVQATDGKKYLIDGGRRIDINSASSEWPLGVDGINLNTLISRLPITATASSNSAFRQSDGAIYEIEASQKRPFNSLRDYFDLGYGARPVLQLSTRDLKLPTGPILFAEGSAYKQLGSDAIYMVGKNGSSFSIRSLKQFNAFKLNPAVPTIDNLSQTQFTIQGALPSLIADDNNQYYIVTDAGRVLLVNSDLVRWGIGTSTAINIGPGHLARINSATITPTFFTAPSGTIFIGENGTARPIGSFQTYKNLGGNSTNTISVPVDLIELLNLGQTYP